MLESTFQCAIFCLNSTINISINSVIRYITDVLEIPKVGLVGSKDTISRLIATAGGQLINNLFYGLIHIFPKDRQVVADVGEIIYLVREAVGLEMSYAFIKQKIESIPDNEMPAELKSTFLTKMQA